MDLNVWLPDICDIISAVVEMAGTVDESENKTSSIQDPYQAVDGNIAMLNGTILLYRSFCHVHVLQIFRRQHCDSRFIQYITKVDQS